MYMKIAICDDCREDIQQVKAFLQGHDARIYYQAGELLADVEEKQLHFDLYLLDIYNRGFHERNRAGKKASQHGC